MIYNTFKDYSLSALGFGCMRFPTFGAGRGAPVNEEETFKLIDYAMKQGVNYFDTGFSYHEGQSERVLGRALKRYPRDSFYLATKFPGHEIRDSFNPKAQFEEQIGKCGVDYFDFYLLHNVYENSIHAYLNPEWGIIDYLLEQKKNGRIRHLGFSCHARMETFLKFLDLYGDQMEFCQLQLNYVDWTLQDAKSKYDILSERGIPVWAMEPLRGGRLAKLTPESEAKLKAERPDESIAAWSFRWLQRLPNVGVILSGMSVMEQVQDNVQTFSSLKPLNDQETKLLEGVAAEMADLLPCTACRYCCSECPQSLNIPTLLNYYNDCRVQPGMVVSMAIDAMLPEERPSACIGCGSCIQVCPQNIDIPGAMTAFQEILNKLPHWADVNKARESAEKK